jgi:tryptophan synthase alpha chain
LNIDGNRIDARFRALREAGRTGLVPYITAGHPHPDMSVELLHALVEAGADLLELGVPFSDVMADGPVIQEACKIALEQGTDLERVLAIVGAFRERDNETPLILMGYMNPVERCGVEAFARRAAEAGADGLLIVDCPADEAAETVPVFSRHGLHQIFLVAPTTTDARLERLAPRAGGFIYYVSLKGVTGSSALDAASLKPALERIRRHSELPVAVGFGISTAEQARAVGEVGDAVVIGSALVKRLSDASSVDEAVALAREYLSDIRAALDARESAEAAGA